MILKLDLNPYDFPEFMNHLYRTTLEEHEDKQNWKVIEENFYDNKQVLSIYAESLLKQGQIDAAPSIIKRHGLVLSEGYGLSDYFGENPKKAFKYVENPLFEKDDFAPTEELLGEASKGTYLCFEDFGLDLENDVIYVRDTETKEFEDAIKDILSSKEVGIDTEFKFQTTIFDVQTTDLLQIATHKKVYIFDALVLKTSAKYIEFIRALLSSSHTLKVGHTLKGDIEMLKNDAVEELGEVAVNHQADISKMYKELNIGVKISLKAICESLLGKGISKYEQVSNWKMRPLRKSQICYAGMDALVSLKLYEILKEKMNGDNVPVA